MAFTQVEVTGTVKDTSGNPMPYIRVEFVLSQNLFSTDNGNMAAATPQTVVTDVNGNYSILLTATDDATTVPRGQVYGCRIMVAGGNTSTQFGINTSFPTYYFALPSSKAPTVTFANLIYS